MPARILIVDDMPAAVKMLAAKLASEYYEVVTATDGASALELVRREEPDLVLLDIMMPGMNGYQVCERIKADPDTTHIPVVMVTALSDMADRVRGLAAGADDFLTKPVNDLMLFARVRSLVRMKRMLDQWRLREETSQLMGFPSTVDDPETDAGSHARVALVDESMVEAANIGEVLKRDRDEVVVIDGDREAPDRVARAVADVAIVSLTIDGEDPLRLCSHLRSTVETRNLPIVLIGEEYDTERLLKALDMGVNDYLVRPIDDNELIARIRTQVRRKRYQDRLRAGFLQNLSLALTDSLTGLHNRRYLSTHMDALMRRMADSRKPLSVMMIDIDHFKRINDTFGHAVGDEVLIEVAQRIARNVRGFDLVARYGGEEFVVVMPDAGLGVATAVADRLRAKLAAEPVAASPPAGEVPITISIGVAEAKKDEAAAALVQRADEALYQAKRDGRNRVVPPPTGNGIVPPEADVG